MDQDILTIRARLGKLTDTLKRNRENVPLEVLKTKYKKGYDALAKNLSRTASGYVLLKVLHDIQIHMDFQEPVMQLINRTTEQSHFLQQISHSIFEKQDLEECDRLAEQLRQKILDELEIFCLQNDVLQNIKGDAGYEQILFTERHLPWKRLSGRAEKLKR